MRKGWEKEAEDKEGKERKEVKGESGGGGIGTISPLFITENHAKNFSSSLH